MRTVLDKSLQRFQPIRRLGGGERADLVLALERGPIGFERPVVLKRPRPHARADAEVLAAFGREAAAYCRLDHPAIVKLHGFFEDDGSVCLVLEYVDGASLSDLLAHVRDNHDILGDDAALFIASRMFAALAAAHAARNPLTGEFAPVLHRDVNPSNVLLPWTGYAKLADFAFAKVTGAGGETTRAGVLKGTYGYMAPEQVLGEPPSTRTDIYAACVVARELLTGRVTFPRHSLPELELLSAMAEPVLAPLQSLRPDLPESLCEALHRGLARDPDMRSVSATQLSDLARSLGDMERGRIRVRELLAPLRNGAISDRVRAAARVPSEFPTLTSAPRIALAHPQSPVVDRAHGALPRASSPDETLRVSALADQVRLSDPTPPQRAQAEIPTIVPRPIPMVRRDSSSAATAAPAPAPLPRRDSLDASLLHVQYGPPSHPTKRGTFGVVASALGMVVLFVLAAMTGLRFVLDARRSTTVVTSAPQGPLVVESPAPMATGVATARSETPNEGVVVVGASRATRVWVDGKLLGEGEREVTLPCGKHEVRIGKAGQAQNVDVPCGGQVRVAPSVDTKL